MNPTVALIPSAYKSGLVYSILPASGRGDFNFNRPSSATRVNPDGLVEEVVSNVPRLDYTNGNCPQLLLERASTNLCLYSQSNFNDQVNWLKFLAPNNLTITEDDIISPDGTLSGAKIEYVNNGQDAVFTQNITVVNGANYVLSIWLKGEQGGEVVKMRLSNNVGGSSGTTDTFTLTDEWVRYETNIKVADAINRGFQLRMEQVGNPLGATFYAWGGQLENNTFASSYIPTEATTVTRSRDLMTDSMAGRTEITSNDWTLFLDFNKSDLGSDNCVSINDGTNDNSIVINNRADDELAFILNQGGTVLSSYIYDITGIDDLKVSFSSTDTGASMVVNGVEIDRLDDGRFDASSLIQIDFTEYGTTNEFAGRVNDFRYYNVALSLNERIKLTQ